MIYTKALEALDKKWHRTVTIDDWRRLGEKADADLTDDDLVIIEGFGGPKDAAAARARRAQALAPVPPEPPAVTKQAAAPAPYVTRAAMMKAFERYSKGTAPVLLDIFTKQKTQIDALGARLASLEAKPHVKFCGVWKAGGTYEPGDAATHQGGLWICKVATPGEPSKDFVGWQLAVKRGSV
jgi:hypothetical protein